MSPVRSLRARLWIGAILWSIGLLLIVAAALVVGLLQFPVAHMAIYTGFAHTVVIAVAIAAVLLVAGLSQVRRGLSSFADLRERLTDVRKGRAGRIEGTHPAEVQPLVSDLNALLDHRERAVRRALWKAGDLAHGMKTPLAVLSREAELADKAGHHALAAAVGEQVQRMQRQVDYHLAQARAAASGATPGASCPLLDSVQGLARALNRLYEHRGLTIDVRVPPAHIVRAQREDIDEMLGNLLDNACTWARSRVAAASTPDGSNIVITIDDDGPGLDPSMREVVLRRGVRADEAAPGSGLGLSIVRDLAEVYGGSVSLDASPSGGLRAKLVLPAV